MLQLTEQPLSDMLAKSSKVGDRRIFQSYEGHIIDALRIFKQVSETQNDFLQAFCTHWGVDQAHFLRNTFVAVAGHDIGKLTRQFQENIRQSRRSSRHPHPFFAVPIFLGFYKCGLIGPLIQGSRVYLELCAMLSHHTELYRNLYEDVQTEVDYCSTAIHEAIAALDRYHIELNLAAWFPGGFRRNVEILPLRSAQIRGFLSNLKAEIGAFEDKPRLKALFTLMFSILQLCDDYSSVHLGDFIRRQGSMLPQTLPPMLTDAEPFVRRLRRISPNDVMRGKTVYVFQQELMDRLPTFGILSAPCGRGKSEAALLWVQGVWQRLNRSRIIFALPTQITSNAMHDRLKTLFGTVHVGLFHGKSFAKLKAEEKERSGVEELGKETIDELNEENFKGNIFFYPVTVTTVDHLVYSFIHGHSQADFALGHIQQAVVIFDEVHYYQGNTVKHLLVLFSILRALNIPHLLMSGTLPEPLLAEAQRINPAFEVIVDEEGFSFTPFRVEIIPEHLITKVGEVNINALEELVSNCRKGLTQFVILNTIARAQAFYEAIRQYDPSVNVMLHHSQFVYKHRLAKEAEIQRRLTEGPLILVSSQVIEISLDISCDIMFTELAPIDALGQRGGRLNRGGRVFRTGDIEHVMKVYEPENDDPYRYPEEAINFMVRTRDRLQSGFYSYARIRDICNAVYEGIRLDSHLLRSVFEECSLFGPSPDEITWHGEGEEGRGFKFRDITYQRVDAMPQTIYYEGGAADKAENLGPVPAWWLKRSFDRHDGNFLAITKRIDGRHEVFDFWLCKLPYSYEKGFEYPEDYEPRGVIF